MQAMQQPPSNHDMETVLSTMSIALSVLPHMSGAAVLRGNDGWCTGTGRQCHVSTIHNQLGILIMVTLSVLTQALELQYCEAMMGALERAGAPAAAAAFAAAAVQQVIKQTLPMPLRPSGLLSVRSARRSLSPAAARTNVAHMLCHADHRWTLRCVGIRRRRQTMSSAARAACGPTCSSTHWRRALSRCVEPESCIDIATRIGTRRRGSTVLISLPLKMTSNRRDAA